MRILKSITASLASFRYRLATPKLSAVKAAEDIYLSLFKNAELSPISTSMNQVGQNPADDRKTERIARSLREQQANQARRYARQPTISAKPICPRATSFTTSALMATTSG